MRFFYTLIKIDGGVNPDTAKRCTEAGADVLVAGSAVLGRRILQKRSQIIEAE